jgi:hypothetical protein
VLHCQLADPGCPATELPRSGASRGGAPSIRSKRRRIYTTRHGDVDFRGVDGGGAGGVDGSGGVGEVRTATTKMEARTLLELFPRDDASYPDGGCELRRPSRGRAHRPPPSSPAASSSMLAGRLLLHARRPPPSSPAASSSMRAGSLLHPRERRCPQPCRWWLPSALPSRRNPRCRGRQRPELDAQRAPVAAGEAATVAPSLLLSYEVFCRWGSVDCRRQSKSAGSRTGGSFLKSCHI